MVSAGQLSSGVMSDISQILEAIEQGDPHAAAELLPLVYDELRRLAVSKLAREKPGQTLQATALVHEAYLRLVGKDASPQWSGRGHFFAAVAEAMRRILIESARRKKRERHGGALHRVDLEEHDMAIEGPTDDVLALDEALVQLAAEDPPAAEVVKLHVYAGLSIEEAAAALGMSRATAYRHWTYARAWLRCALGKANENS
jgi:RNA polymerase sigma factor (TIGR02999 family)